MGSMDLDGVDAGRLHPGGGARELLDRPGQVVFVRLAVGVHLSLTGRTEGGPLLARGVDQGAQIDLGNGDARDEERPSVGGVHSRGLSVMAELYADPAPRRVDAVGE